MIDDAVRVLKGEVEAAEPIEVKIDLGMSMHIPQTYVDSEVVRLDLYKRISYLDSIEDIEDQLQELEDRFGKPPKEVRALLYVSYMTKLAQKAGISHITRTKGRTVFTYADLSGFSAKSLMKLPDSIGKRLSFSVKSTAELRLSGPSSLKEIDIMLENLIK
jgi:transcription-repair coupling factor (superfamily II helicase)